MNKNNYFFLCLVVFLCFTLQAYGQFNTITAKGLKTKRIEPLSPSFEPTGNARGDTDSASFARGADTVSLRPEAVGGADDADVSPTFPDSAVNKRCCIAIGYEDMVRLAGRLALPLDSIAINSRYGMRRHPVYGKRRPHYGIDLKADGDYVYSVMDGRVSEADSNRVSGNYVVIVHAGFQSVYCHLSRKYVAEDDTVFAGQIIGKTGSTGVSTKEHLHFALKRGGRYIDPEPFISFVKGFFEYVDAAF